MKSFLIHFLLPIAYLNQHLGRVKRLWAFVTLKAGITGEVDPSVLVLGAPELHGTRNIYLGKNLMLYRELYLETQEVGEIHIGDDVVISRGVHIVAFHQIHIGRGSMIGEYSSLRDADHVISTEENIRESGYHAQSIRIGNNVWIGRSVAILKGVSIGDNAVIAANAVVTKDVAAGSVVGGVPAHALK
jgi:acetyltransferase-like isoleucine patch superfamily enzyme